MFLLFFFVHYYYTTGAAVAVWGTCRQLSSKTNSGSHIHIHSNHDAAGRHDLLAPARPVHLIIEFN